MRNINISRWISLIIGILLIISGITYFLNPVETTMSLIKIFAATLMLIGVLRIARYFIADLFRSGAFLIAGGLDIALGVIMLRNLETSIIAFTSLIGFWILFHGLIEIAAAIDFKNSDIKRWWVTLLNGIVGIIFGIMVLNNYVLLAIYISTIISIFLILFGISFISTFFALSRYKRMF